MKGFKPLGAMTSYSHAIKSKMSLKDLLIELMASGFAVNQRFGSVSTRSTRPGVLNKCM